MTPKNICRAVFTFAVLSTCGFAASPALAAIDIINENFEAPDAYLVSFYGNVSQSGSVKSGAGVGGSTGMESTSNLPATAGTAGVTLTTINNPNLFVTDPSLVSISFDLRDTAPKPGSVNFYVQTFPGIYSGPATGLWETNITPTSQFQTYSFKLSDLKVTRGTVIPNYQTFSLGWQVGAYLGAGPGTNVFDIDNVIVSVPGSLPAAVPEMSPLALLGLGLLPLGLVARRRMAHQGA